MMTRSFRESISDLRDGQPVVLTIAGFDPSGGAGIIADIKTFLAFGCVPTAAITSLTFQNRRAVSGVIHQTAGSLRSQLVPIIEAFNVAALKTGMLPTREIVLEVARLIREKQLPAPVVDPVMRSSSGYELMNNDAVEALLSELLPLVRVITPNIPEAEALTGLAITNESEMREAARKLREMGARAALIKGGHLKQGTGVRGQGREKEKSGFRDQRSRRGTSPTRGPQMGSPAGVGAVREGSRKAIDILDDEDRLTIFRGNWIDAPPVRGTGCILSSAISACLSKGMSLEEAVGKAKSFVAEVIGSANTKLETE